jgi:hypothetical protein
MKAVYLLVATALLAVFGLILWPVEYLLMAWDRVFKTKTHLVLAQTVDRLCRGLLRWWSVE